MLHMVNKGRIHASATTTVMNELDKAGSVLVPVPEQGGDIAERCCGYAQRCWNGPSTRQLLVSVHPILGGLAWRAQVGN